MQISTDDAPGPLPEGIQASIIRKGIDRVISKYGIEDALIEDAYIESLSMSGNDLKLDLECFAETDDRFMPDENAESVMVRVSITFEGVYNLTIDGIAHANASQLMKYADIESFERNDHSVEMFVNWRDNDARLNRQVMYEFDYHRLRKTVGEKYIWRWKKADR